MLQVGATASNFFAVRVRCALAGKFPDNGVPLRYHQWKSSLRFKRVLFPDFVWRVAEIFLVILYWFGGKLIKNQEILKQSCKDLFIWTELPIVWLIIGSDNYFQHRTQWSISNTRYRDYSCCQVEPTTKVFVTWFATILVFIHFHFSIYLNQHTLLL